jgi:hypothetical protein
MGIQVVAIALIVMFPAIATWLPQWLFDSGALVVSDPVPAASSPYQGYGESYEQMYQRQLEALPAPSDKQK